MASGPRKRVTGEFQIRKWIKFLQLGSAGWTGHPGPVGATGQAGRNGLNGQNGIRGGRRCCNNKYDIVKYAFTWAKKQLQAMSKLIVVSEIVTCLTF